MIYFQNDQLLIRNMRPEDAQVFTDEENAQGWHQTTEKYLLRLRDQEEGRAVSLVAEWRGQPAGYINVYLAPRHGPFAGQGIPEIVDFGVLQKFQRRGIGERLMETAEHVAARCADRVCLGVGLHSGYGSAQRMYVKRGYVPDGSGLWYRDRPCPQGAPCRNDDDLVLYLSKSLKPMREKA